MSTNPPISSEAIEEQIGSILDGAISMTGRSMNNDNNDISHQDDMPRNEDVDTLAVNENTDSEADTVSESVTLVEGENPRAIAGGATGCTNFNFFSNPDQPGEDNNEEIPSSPPLAPRLGTAPDLFLDIEPLNAGLN